jgi:hypothetical protein
LDDDFVPELSPEKMENWKKSLHLVLVSLSFHKEFFGIGQQP